MITSKEVGIAILTGVSIAIVSLIIQVAAKSGQSSSIDEKKRV